MVTWLNKKYLVTHIKKYFFNNMNEIDKKIIEYFKDYLLCVCVQILLIWSCDHGRIPQHLGQITNETLWLK